MEALNFRDTLKRYCVEIYNVPATATKDKILVTFQDAAKAAHFVPPPSDGQRPKWLVLLQNPEQVTEVLQRSGTSPLLYDDAELSVTPCAVPCDIPMEWEQYLQVLPVGTTGENASSQSAEFRSFSPQAPIAKGGQDGYPSPEEGMAYPPQQPINYPYPQQMGQYPTAPPGMGNILPYPQAGPQVPGQGQSSSKRGKHGQDIGFQYPNMQQQPGFPYPYQFIPPSFGNQQRPPIDQYMQTPPHGYSRPPWEYQQSQIGPDGRMMYPSYGMAPPPYSSHIQDSVIKDAAKDHGTESKYSGKPSNEESDSDSDDSVDEKVKTTNRIKVTKISSKVTESKLKSFFKNKKASGGGTIQSVDYRKDTGEAIVEFKDTSVIERILQKCPLLLEEKQVHIEKYFSESEEEEEEEEEVCSCTIEVRGMKDTTTSDTLQYYFESKRAAGECLEIVEFDYNAENGIAHVKFKCQEDMQKILSRSHKVDDVKLETKEYIPPKPRPLYEDKVLLRGVNSSTTKDGLINFLEAKTNATPNDVAFGEEGVVIVSFKEPLNFEKLAEACEKKSIDGNFLQMSRIPISNCVMVTGISDGTGSDTLQFYFENKRRSGGGEVENIEYNQEDGTCLVYFEDHKVVDPVCAKKHTIDKHEISVRMYHPTIGETVGSDGPKFKVPEHITVTTIDERKVQFLLYSGKSKDTLTRLLTPVYSSVIWPTNYKDNIKIHCKLTSQVKDYRKLAKTWKKDTLGKLDNYLATLSVERINVLQDAWKDMMAILQKKNIQNPESITVAVEKVTCEIFIMGHLELVSQMSDEIKRDLKALEEELDRKKQQVTEHSDVKLHQLLLLHEQHFLEEMQIKYKGMKVTSDLKNRRITFEGLSTEVLEAKVKMFEFINSIASSHAGSVSERKCKLLQDPKVKKYILQLMKKDDVFAVWDVVQTDMKTYAMCDSSAVKAAHILKEALIETSIAVPKESQYILTTDMWEDKMADVKQNNATFPVIIDCKEIDGTIIVCSSREDNGAVLEIIQNFLSDNTILEAKLNLNAGIMRFLQRSDKQIKIQNIAKSLQADQVKIEVSNMGIILRGTVVGLNKTRYQMNALIQRVVKKKHTLNKPGITKFMQSDDGEDKLRRAEGLTNVIIIPDEGDDSLDKDLQQRGEVVQEIARCEQNGCSIMVMLGDITELQVDVLVNAANSKLKHDGGLAKAIVVKGGIAIQKECEEHVKKRGQVSEGDVFCGIAGNLKCQMIAHAVSPAWQNGNSSEEYILGDAVDNCLKETKKRGFKSVAIPALGAGTFGVPIEVAVRVITSSVEEFVNEKQYCSIQHIYLCDVKREHVDAFTKALKRRFGKQNVQETNNSADVQHWSTVNTSERSYRGRRDVQSAYENIGNSSTQSYRCLDGNIQINLVKGEIAKQKVDIIVNTAGTDLQLHNGAVSNSLLQAAGKSLQAECSQLYPQGIKLCEVAVTGGHKLKCQNVCHGSLPQWDGGAAALTVLQQFMINCLEEGNSRALRTVAFPAMGTGNLGFPKDVVAKEMYRIVSQYANDNPKSTLQKVDFVVYPKDKETVMAFEDAEKVFNQPPIISAPKQNSPPDSKEIQTGRKSRKFGQLGKGSRDTDNFDEDIGKITLKIYLGDIIQANVDAIVNSTNAQFDLTRGAVARAIKEKGGKDLEKQIVLKKRDMKNEGVAVTTSGSGFNCKFVIHLNTEERTKSTWKSKILMALQQAEETGSINSVAFPALGTALAGGPTPENVAGYFFDALMEFQASAKTLSLQEVHIVIFQEDMLLKFLNTMRICLDTIKSVKPKSYGNKSDEEWNRKPNILKIAMNPSSYPLVIYGDSDKDINYAITKLEEILEKAYGTKSFKEPIIKKFSVAEESSIKHLEAKFCVDVKLEIRTGQLQLYGLQDSITAASDEIYSILRDKEREKQSEQEAELIADMVVWCYIEVTSTGQDVVEYPTNVNRLIEKAFKRQESNVSFQDEQGNTYIVDFNTLEEYPEDNTTDRAKVLRKSKMESSKFDMPSNWTVMNDQDNLIVVALQPSDQEFKDVVAEFQKTIGTQRNVSKVERIQNRTLYQQYDAKKILMEKQNPPGTQNERFLWHGTAPEAVDSINTHGFNRSYCGKNATAFGLGVYFAVNTQYSASNTYSRPDGSGNKRMYYCRVLTGQFTVGNSAYRVPPQKPNSPSHILYDSVVNDVANPAMYIIFNDTQGYPDYLLTFT